MPLVPVYLNLPIGEVRRLVLAIADAYGLPREAVMAIARRVIPAVSLSREEAFASDADELPPVLRDTDPAPPPSDH